MPKTKDAFALRDFDGERILQRPFFKGFHFDADKSDAEILQDLSLGYDDSLSTLERKHKVLNEIFNNLSRLDVLVCKHSKRLKIYRQKLKKKIKSVGDDVKKMSLEKRDEFGQRLGFEYVLVIDSDIENLMQLVENKWHELENRLQETYRKNFAERLKQARIKANLSRKQLGDAINISPNGFGLYETGKREPTLTSLIRLARTLNVSADWLIGATA